MGALYCGWLLDNEAIEPIATLDQPVVKLNYSSVLGVYIKVAMVTKMFISRIMMAIVVAVVEGVMELAVEESSAHI